MTVGPGIRQSAQVLIYVDVRSAMGDGIKFYRSQNGVVLSPGNQDGFLSSKYFERVVDRKTMKPITVTS